MRGQEASGYFRACAEDLDGSLRDMADLDRELREAIAGVEAEQTELSATLAKVYLPELTEGALERAEKMTGFRGFSGRKPLVAMEREDHKLRARIAKLEADEHWTQREHLTGPQGKWMRELAEAKDLLEPWEQDCARFEQLDGFLELVEIGYDTPAFEERWWQPGYWRHWAAGDRICTSLELADFGDDVMPAYQAAKEPREKWRKEVARISNNIRQVHEHVRDRDQAVWRLENLVIIYLEEAQALLAEHLRRADEQLLGTWAGDDRGVVVLLKRLSGLAAKRELLDEMKGRWLTPWAEATRAEQAKYQQKAAKLARPKKWNLEVAVPAGHAEKVAAQAQRRQKARDTIRRIRRYDRYDQFDLAQPPETWWLHFNDGRRPGIFTPGLRSWYDRRPDVVIVTDPLWSHPTDPLEHTGTSVAAGDLS